MATTVSRVFSILGFPVIILFSMIATILRTPVIGVPVILIALFYNFEHIAALFAGLG